MGTNTGPRRSAIEQDHVVRRRKSNVVVVAMVLAMIPLVSAQEPPASGSCSAASPCPRASSPCCSSSGFCGFESNYCGSNCDPAASFKGSCSVAPGSSASVPDTSSCASDPNSCVEGACCSKSQFCGFDSDHCGAGCTGGACANKKPPLSTGAVIGICLASFVVISVLVGGSAYAARRRHKKNKDQSEGFIVKYSYKTIAAATRNFATPLGKGGFGEVFKGTLNDNTEIAVKRLRVTANESANEQKPRHASSAWPWRLSSVFRKTDNASAVELNSYEAEIDAMGRARVSHVNLVTLKGYCFRKETNERYLVYEFVPNWTLADWLFQPRKPDTYCLHWDRRKEIAYGVARALEYLHKSISKNHAIIHLDIKPENVLLNKDLTPKVADFGSAQILLNMSEINVAIVGTRVYKAPELQDTHSKASVKSDVFSYGIVLLELVTGRRVCTKETNEYLPLLAAQAAEKGSLLKIVDKDLEMSTQPNNLRVEAIRFLRVGLWCVQQNPINRPEMGEVINLLNGAKLAKFPVNDKIPDGLERELEELGQALLGRGVWHPTDTSATTTRTAGPTARSEIFSTIQDPKAQDLEAPRTSRTSAGLQTSGLRQYDDPLLGEYGSRSDNTWDGVR